jgi:uncharacterized membrane protein
MPQSDATPLRGVDSPSLRTRLQFAIVCALCVGYAALSHYAYSDPDAKGLGATLSVAPVVLIGVILVWRWAHPLAALVVAAFSCAMLYRYWPVVEHNYAWSDLVQQCGAYSLIALSFARSLLAGRTPLCTQWANKIYGELEPIEISYTRGATFAWALLYTLIAIAILVLFFLTSPRLWSVFVDFVTFGLIIVMGVADHAIRRRVLPRHPGGGLLGVIRRSLIG